MKAGKQEEGREELAAKDHKERKKRRQANFDGINGITEFFQIKEWGRLKEMGQAGG